MSFKIGRKAVCINGDFWAFNHGYGRTCTGPSTNEIVTVVDIVMEDGVMGLLLKEYNEENEPYCAIRFRPIDYSIGESVCESITKECEKETVKEVIELHQ